MSDVKDCKDGRGGKDDFEGRKRALMERSPYPGDILINKGSVRDNDVEVI